MKIGETVVNGAATICRGATHIKRVFCGGFEIVKSEKIFFEYNLMLNFLSLRAS